MTTAIDVIQYKKTAGDTDYPTKDSNFIDVAQPVIAAPQWPFSYKPATTTGLTLGYYGGQMLVDGVLTAISDGTVALTLSTTNYIEATRAGVVSKNTTGFTAGSIPLYTAATGAGAITTLTDLRAFNQPHFARLALASTGGTTTLTYAQSRVDAIDVTGTLTSHAIIEVPASAWEWAINNGTSGAYTLTVKVNGQTGVTIPQGERRVCVCDATDVRALTGYVATDGDTMSGALTISSGGLTLTTGNIAVSAGTVTVSADPSSALQVATKQYVDSVASGLDIHPSCRAATTANIASLAGGAPNSLDGVTLAANDRILVKDQSTGSQNGLYYVSTLGTGANGTWTRATDADATGEISAGLFVWVTEGTLAGDTGWVLTTNDTITVGSTSLAFQQFTGVGQLSVTAPLTKTAPNTLAVSAASDTASGVSELATSAETQTGTDTARVVTPAGLSATAAYQGKQTVWIPAGAMVSRTTSGAASGTAETTTNKVMVKTLDFDASTAEYAQFSVAMPKSWNGSTVTAQFCWSNASGTGNVIWGLQGVAISDDDVLDAAFGTAQTVTDGVTAAGDLMQSAETSAITIAGTPASLDLVVFQVYRDAANGSDTLAVDARLHGVRLYITTNAKNDA